MESEQRYYELRSGSRSRSHTPLVQNRALAESEILDRHYDLRNRSRDRSGTPGETINGKRSSTGSKMHDQSMETITERKDEIISLDASENHSKRPGNSSISVKKAERRSERQKAKRDVHANGQKEKKDGSFDEKYEKTNKSISAHRTITSDYSSEEGEKEHLSNRYETISLNSLNVNDHGKAKIEYTKTYVVERHLCNKQTIYTDSRGSTNSRSRQSLCSDSPLKRIDSRKLNVKSSVDSDTELDDAVTTSSRSNEQRTLMKHFTRFTSIVALWFNRLFEFLNLKTVRRREHHDCYEYSRHESKWYKAWRYVDRCLQYVYVFIVKAFFFDSWLLSRVSNIRKWMQQRSPKVLWVALLPLLILMGSWCLPYISTSLLSIDPIIGQLRGQHRTMTELFLADRESSFKAERFGEAEDFKTIAEKLYNRIRRLEDQTIEQTNRLLNMNGTIEKLRENDFVWSRLDNKILSLEKSMEDRDLVDTYDEEIRAMKLQFNALKELYSDLKLCCNTRFDRIGNDDLEKRVETILAKYFGASVSKKDLLLAIQNAILAADEYESGVGANTNTNTNTNMDTGVDTDTDTAKARVESSFVANDERVRKIVRDALRIYDADKTGRVDYALESAGGQIISTRCTQRYDINTRAFKLLTFMLYHENNNPRTVIQGNPIQPGACWAFQGFPGYLLIKLRSSIHVTGFTVEHAPKSILPNGEMKSAPKKFNVWGFVDENDPLPVMFGDYEFAATDDNLQYFPVQNTTIGTPYEFVELRVNSNHGQLEYTCLYRFRVHGTPV
ncbi:uncharacterized protein LOC143352165 isoform X2 [Halictus rubicundus]|uniref:uncharacterized protein LOC143352165 isoform X2 n=1 Tax=Halictus rubicundus TaxID=77578 RepID=UPI004035A8EA